MSELTEQELLREARRTLRKLVPARARLKRQNDGRWMVLAHSDAVSGRTRVSAEMAAAFCRLEWIAPAPDDGRILLLTEAGRKFIASELAGSNALADRHRVLSLKTIANDSGGETLVAVNETESPLGWLKVRGQIDASQHEAGERLRRDYTLAQLEPRLGIGLSMALRGPAGADNAGLMTDTVLAAKQRFSRAMSAVGQGLSDVLFDVCCALKGLEAVETQNDWPKRSGKVVLRLALDRLAGHYGIRNPLATAPIRMWKDSKAETKALTPC